MTLKDDIAEAVATGPKNFKAWLTVAPADEREMVVKAIKAAPDIKLEALAQALRKNGIPCQARTLRDYRVSL